MSVSAFSPMSDKVRAIFSRLYVRLDNREHYYTAYMLAETETDLGDYSRPIASIARKRVTDRSDAPQWKVTLADEHATPIVEMDSRLTIKGTENHMKRAIAEFLYARELERAAIVAEIKKGRDVPAVASVGSSLFSAESLAELAAIEGVSVMVMTPDNVGDVHNAIAAHIGEPSAALHIAEILDANESDMLDAEKLAKANGWTYHVSRFAGNPTFQHAEHGTVMADNWIELCAEYPMESPVPSETELRGMRLFNCQTRNAEPDWRGYTSLELAACRNDKEAVTEEGGNPETDTHIETCHYTEAEFFSVYARDKEGLAECITDIQDRDSVLDIVAELIETSGLPCTFAFNFGMR